MIRRVRLLVGAALLALISPLVALGAAVTPANAEPSPGEWLGSFSVRMETVEDGGLFRQWSTVEVTVFPRGPGDGYGELRIVDWGYEGGGCSATMVSQDPESTISNFSYHEEQGHLLADVRSSERVDLVVDECGTETVYPLISTDWIYFCGDPIPATHELDLGLIEDDPANPGRRVVIAPTEVTCQPGDAEGSWTMTPSLSAAGTPERVPSTITLNYTTGRLVRVNGQVDANAAGEQLTVTLERRKGRRWVDVGAKSQTLSAASRYVIKFPQQNVLLCRATARFKGSPTLLPSRATKIFSC